jgi:hypothetical protein
MLYNLCTYMLITESENMTTNKKERNMCSLGIPRWTP